MTEKWNGRTITVYGSRWILESDMDRYGEMMQRSGRLQQESEGKPQEGKYDSWKVTDEVLADLRARQSEGVVVEIYKGTLTTPPSKLRKLGIVTGTYRLTRTR